MTLTVVNNEENKTITFKSVESIEIKEIDTEIEKDGKEVYGLYINDKQVIGEFSSELQIRNIFTTLSTKINISSHLLLSISKIRVLIEDYNPEKLKY